MITVEELWHRDGGRCWLCGDEVSLHEDASRDHVVPRYAGGTNSSFNLSLAHICCNSNRDHRDYEEGWTRFVDEIHRLHELWEATPSVDRIRKDPWARERFRAKIAQMRKERRRKFREFLRRINPDFKYPSHTLKEELKWREDMKGEKLTYKEIRAIRSEYEKDRPRVETKRIYSTKIPPEKRR